METAGNDQFDDDTLRLLDLEVKEVPEMPDPTLSVQDMKDYGYAWAGVLPAGQEADVYKRQGTAPVTPEPDKDAETDAPAPKPEKKSNIGMILVIFALAGAAGAAYYYIKFVKGRKPKDEDMDFFDDEGYEEEPYINEDEEPQIAEDAETEGDED